LLKKINTVFLQILRSGTVSKKVQTIDF
jgi:hypothetical protein